MDINYSDVRYHYINLSASNIPARDRGDDWDVHFDSNGL